jgi:hypothetical protein
MTCTLPNVTLKGLYLRALFVQFADTDVSLENEADAFIAEFELEGQVTAEQLVVDYQRDTLAMAIALIEAILLHWSQWYGTETGIALILMATWFFAAAFGIVCINI